MDLVLVLLSILILQVVVQLMDILKFNPCQVAVLSLLLPHPVQQYQVVTAISEQDLLSSIHLPMEHLLVEDLDSDVKWIQMTLHNLLKWIN